MAGAAATGAEEKIKHTHLGRIAFEPLGLCPIGGGWETWTVKLRFLWYQFFRRLAAMNPMIAGTMSRRKRPPLKTP
jgi:hypothetical protein